MAGITKRERVQNEQIVEESSAFMLKFIRNCATAYENNPDIFLADDDQAPIKRLKKMIIRGMDYAHDYALKGLPDKHEQNIGTNDAFVKNILDKLGASDDKSQA